MKLGDRLSEIIESDWGVRLLAKYDRNCATCQDWVDQINTWGVLGTRKYRDRIVNHLILQAQETLTVPAPKEVVRSRVNRWIDKAIEAENGSARLSEHRGEEQS